MIDVDDSRQQILFVVGKQTTGVKLKGFWFLYIPNPFSLARDHKLKLKTSPTLTDNVFPDPVCATPTISNPLRATGHP